MKILELYLKAFGPFTEKRLEFQPDAGGLQVVFGSNEAGKSSALRALQSLLYGIPRQTSDNFLHEHTRMRVGARILHPAAGELAFLRRKGNQKTLRDFDDATALPDNALEPYLRGVPADLFDRLFGIDYTELIEGSKSLLEVDGDLGHALFSAGLGSGGVRDVLKALSDEADELFRPRASKPSINAAIGELISLRRGIRDKSLKGRDWKQHEHSHEAAGRELEELSRKIELERTQQTRLERIRSALSPLEKRRTLLREVSQLEEVIELPAAFEARLRAAFERKRNATRVSSESQAEQSQNQARLEDLQLDVKIMTQRDVIEQLKQALGTYKSAAKDLPRREIERSQRERDLVAGLVALRPELTPDRLDELRVPLGRRGETKDLVKEHAALEARIEGARQTLLEQEAALEKARRRRDELGAPRDASTLHAAAKSARSLGDIDSRLDDTLRQLDTETQDCEARLAAQGLWSGSLAELERLKVPQKESVERFQEEFHEIDSRRQRSGELLDDAESKIRECELQLETLRRTGSVPMESELSAGREQRDRGWRLLRKHWIDGEPVDEEIRTFAQDQPLPELYERSVSTADEVADRLRREADRVAEQAAFTTQLTQAKESRAAARKELAQLETEEAEQEASWRALWQPSGVEPNPPREMLVWLRRHGELVQMAATLRRSKEALAKLTVGRSEARSALADALSPFVPEALLQDVTLQPLRDRSDEIIAELGKVETDRIHFDEQAEAYEASVERAAEALSQSSARRESWSEEWNAATAGLGLAPDGRPTSALDALETSGRLMDLKREIDELDTRISGMRRDSDSFASEVRAFVAAHAPELAERSLEESVQSFGHRLSEVDRQETLRKEIQGQIAGHEETHRKASLDFAEAEHELKSLREVAGCAEDEDLEPALAGWQKKSGLLADLSNVEQQLVDVAAGCRLGDLEAEAEGVDRDSLPGQIQACVDRIAEMEKSRHESLTTQAQAQAELNRMDGSADAAEEAFRAQEVEARLRNDIERYVRLRLARTILQREIERYRDEHQSPVLGRASELFAELTLGSFARLQSDYDEDEKPALIGVRADGSQKEVHKMSSGARAQLYLALRLATVEEWVAQSGPMPLIVDDVLLDFDDDRARATLKVLAEVGKTTQVLLFTHLGRDRFHAEELGIPVLELGRG